MQGNFGLSGAFTLASCVLGAVLVAVVAKSADAQPVAEDKPRFVLNPGGPVNLVRTLAFSPDSTRLYSAGHDKVVHTWEIRDAGKRIRRIDVPLVQTLRWEISRGLRGVIYTAAANPVDRRLAIGGYTARDNGGDIVVFDTAQGVVERALEGHLQTIAALDYSPDGQRLASLSVDGELRVWTGPAWGSRILTPAAKQTFPVRHARFLNTPQQHLAVSQPAGAVWRVLLFDPTAPAPPIVLPTPHQGSVTAIARDSETAAWATADAAGHVYLWNGAQNAAGRLLRQGRLVEDLAFGPRGTLFVASRAEDEKKLSALLEMWDVSNGQLLDAAITSSVENNYACVVSPDRRWVATCGDDRAPIYLYPLVDVAGQPLQKPLSEGKPVVLRGRGTRVGKVAFAANAPLLGFGPADDRRLFNNYGGITAAFDLQKSRLLPAGQLKAPPQWQTVERGAQGWTARKLGENWQRLELSQQGQPRCTITLDPAKQGAARSYCWLGDATRVFAIAIGTDHQNGIFVYWLVNGGECPLLRYYRDHTGWVSSLSVSSDGKYLASGSADQSIKIWSLEGLRTAAEILSAQAGFPKAPAWGATFQKLGGRVAVTSASAAGIAFARGLRKGDVIVGASFSRNGQVIDAKLADAIYAALVETPIFETLVLDVQRGGQVLPKILLVPAWEPLSTLFVDRRGEWALSTPQGPYDASVDGNELFGWQINRGRGLTPEFFQADQFRDKLERPDVLRRLLSAGNLPDALQQAGEKVPPNLESLVTDLTGESPRVTILEPADGQRFGEGQPIRLRARVDYPTDQMAQQFAVSAFVNGSQPAVTNNQLVGRQRTLQWQLQPNSPYNSAVVLSEGNTAKAGELFDFKSVHFRAATADQKPRLHLLTLAAGDYNAEELKLGFPVADATSFAERLQADAASLYRPGLVRQLHDRDITRASVDTAIDEFLGQIGIADTGDLWIVFLAGHGVALDNVYYFVPPAENLTKADQYDVIKEIGVTWSQFQRIGRVPCRKVVLLDTCHSGNVLLEDNPPSHMKMAVRVLKQKQMLVVAATDANQSALEIKTYGHGVFTKCLLDGFDGKADQQRDGEIDFAELVEYVQQEVPKLTSTFQLQTPRSTPTELLRSMVFVPLTRYQAPVAGGGK